MPDYSNDFIVTSQDNQTAFSVAQRVCAFIRTAPALEQYDTERYMDACLQDAERAVLQQHTLARTVGHE